MKQNGKNFGTGLVEIKLNFIKSSFYMQTENLFNWFKTAITGFSR